MSEVKGLKKLMIVGLGNPGERYAMTRHNIGFIVVDALADKFGWPFKHQRHLQASLAKGEVDNVRLFLLKPETYMNLSGHAVKKFLELHDCSPEAILVVVDDADLPFGQLRLKAFGSSGGHNGLKSIEGALQTNRFARLRVGIGRAREVPLVDYVLMPFNSEEAGQLPAVVEHTHRALQLYIREPIAEVMNQVNKAALSQEEGLKSD